LDLTVLGYGQLVGYYETKNELPVLVRAVNLWTIRTTVNLSRRTQLHTIN